MPTNSSIDLGPVPQFRGIGLLGGCRASGPARELVSVLGVWSGLLAVEASAPHGVQVSLQNWANMPEPLLTPWEVEDQTRERFYNACGTASRSGTTVDAVC